MTATKDEPSALVPGVSAAFLGVSDPAPHLDFYCGRLGFAVAERGDVLGEQAARLWGVDRDVPYVVLTAAGAAQGRIILLTVTGADEAVHPHTADLGLVGIDVYTDDIVRAHADLTAAGHPWATAPATWEVPLGDTLVTVTEGFCYAPEGTDVVFVQPEHPRGTAAWAAEPERPYTEVTSLVCHVPDVDAEVAFWGPGGLGLEVWYDLAFSSPGLEEMAGLPPGTKMRLAFLAGRETARIEVTQVGDGTLGIDRRDGQRTAQALGHTGWLIDTPDLDRALAMVRDRGGRITSGPFDGAGGLFGARRVAFVDTPGGIPVTIQEEVR